MTERYQEEEHSYAAAVDPGLTMEERETGPNEEVLLACTLLSGTSFADAV